VSCEEESIETRYRVQREFGPIGVATSWNRYGYVLGDPVRTEWRRAQTPLITAGWRRGYHRMMAAFK
jgi:hypothetical protein